MATETAHPNALEKDHNLVVDAARAAVSQRVHYEKRPVKGLDGRPVEGLYIAWIILDNPTQFNSYTTDMIKATILAFRAASSARDVVAVVLTGSGEKAFCTGGNTRNTRSTTPAIPRNTGATCDCSTTW
jgi:6-oxo-cyclohex-1-ene-carbonyl-CoA hydrolase